MGTYGQQRKDPLGDLDESGVIKMERGTGIFYDLKNFNMALLATKCEECYRILDDTHIYTLKRIWKLKMEALNVVKVFV